MLKVKNVSKDYHLGRRKLRVLHGVSLEVAEGEFLCIAGPSGAGKSTLLHLIGLLDTPTEGEIFFGHQPLSGLTGNQRATWRSRIFGFVFQFYHLMPDFTALENVCMPVLAGAGLRGWTRQRRRATKRASRVLEMVGLAERASHKPLQLSGGERQRVAIARALINQPKVLLCDEPTGNLDIRTGKKILALLDSIRRDTDCTLVMVTHDEHVAAGAERKLGLVDGRIEKQ